MIVDLKKNGLPFNSQEESDSISLVVRNTTTSTVYANILGATTNLKDNANATISYSYNLAGETYLTDSITIQYRPTTQATFQTATLPLLQQNIEGVVAALNQFLGIGTWFYSGNDIVTYNNNYVFGTLGVTAVTTYAGQINVSFATGAFTGLRVDAIARQADGKIILGGSFTNYAGNPVGNVVRLNTDGSYDNTFLQGTGFLVADTVYSITIQPDGKILFGGNLNSYNGNACGGLVRVNTNGTYDATFNSIVGTGGTIYQTVIQPDGKIIAAGSISSWNGNPAVGVVRINTNGSYDATFNSITGVGAGICLGCALQTDGKVILVGGFITYNGIPANDIVRLNTNGTYDGTFNSTVGANNTIYKAVIQPDGKIIAVGFFTTYNGTTANRIVRINTNGSYDATFNSGTGFDNQMYDLVLQSNGKVIVVGRATIYNTVNFISKIARLNTDGSFDATFQQGVGFFAGLQAESIIYNATNNLITVGGDFTAYDGNPAQYVVQIYTVSPA